MEVAWKTILLYKKKEPGEIETRKKKRMVELNLVTGLFASIVSLFPSLLLTIPKVSILKQKSIHITILFQDVQWLPDAYRIS